MTVREVAEREALRLLEYVDPALMAQRITAQPRPIEVKQRGRTGRVTAFDASKHPRGAHGMFATGSGGGARASAAKRPAAPQGTAQIKAFQKQYGLPQTGKLDGATRATLAAPPPQTLGQMASGEAKAKAAAEASKRKESRAKTEARRKEEGKPPLKTKAENEKGAKGERSKGSSSKGERARRGRQSKAEAQANRAAAAKERVQKNISGQAWTGALNATEPLQVGTGTGKSKGETASPAVGLLQSKLQALGFGANIAQDGKFGPETATAVKVLQKEYGLKPDGVVGPQTLQLIETLTQRSMRWQKQGIIEAAQLPGESVSGYTRCVLSALSACS